MDAEFADFESWPVVHPEDAVDGEQLEQPILHHDPAAGDVLLGGLEDEAYRTVEVPRLGEVARREIGRASCRESVCQYVSISVVAGSLKKKSKKKTSTNT